MNLPNLLSGYRILAAPFLGLLIYYDESTWFRYLLLFSFLTDAADGYIARRWHISSRLGAQLDSVGDALTFLVAVAGVFGFHYDFLMEHSTLIMVAFLPYLLQILMAVIIYGRPSSFHTYLAKLAALSQACFFMALFFFGPWMWLFYLSVAITMLEIAEEMLLLFVIKEWETDVKGIYWVWKNRKWKKWKFENRNPKFESGNLKVDSTAGSE